VLVLGGKVGQGRGCECVCVCVCVFCWGDENGSESSRVQLPPSFLPPSDARFLFYLHQSDELGVFVQSGLVVVRPPLSAGWRGQFREAVGVV
jgi:hypothetical protein